MTHTRTPSTRRDERFILPPGVSVVEYSAPDGSGAILAGTLILASVSGLAFEVEGEPEQYPAETFIEHLVIRVGESVFEGSAVVRNSRRAHSSSVELGCLFYPSDMEEDRWQSFLAGIELGRRFATEKVG